MYYNYALDSLYENDIIESVPVAPGEQSLCEQAAAAARALEPSHKRKCRVQGAGRQCALCRRSIGVLAAEGTAIFAVIMRVVV